MFFFALTVTATVAFLPCAVVTFNSLVFCRVSVIFLGESEILPPAGCSTVVSEIPPADCSAFLRKASNFCFSLRLKRVVHLYLL